MSRKSGKTSASIVPPLTDEEIRYREKLRRDIEHLAGDIGERNIRRYENLCEAADFIQASLEQTGYAVERQSFNVAGKTCYNIEVEISGDKKSNEIIIVGSHYDTVIDCAGANDNGSGVAAMLALARAFCGKDISHTLRFVAFVNEEPPWFRTANMGSLVYAKRCRERDENISAMFSLETIGYFSDQHGSQHYPFPLGFLYPSTGNFIAFVSNLRSRRLLNNLFTSFRRQVRFPVEKGAWPGILPGIGWSDQWAFWKMGYPALMITDTAPFRYPYYHTSLDTPDKIMYDHLSRVVVGLKLIIAELVKVRQNNT